MSNTDDVAVEDLIRRKLASRSDTMCTASCITLRRQFWLVAIIPTGHTFDDGPNECRRESRDSGNAFSALIEAHARFPGFDVPWLRIPLAPPRTKQLTRLVFLTFFALQILPLLPGRCANRATTVFTQRRIRAAFATIAARASRLRILVVRQSLPSKPTSCWAGEAHNVRHSKDGRLLHRASMG